MGLMEFLLLLIAKGLATIAMGFLLCVGFSLGTEAMLKIKSKLQQKSSVAI